VHPDLEWVQNGYELALKALMKLLKAPEPQASDPDLTRVRNDLVSV
jgi:hypothetical protein